MLFGKNTLSGAINIKTATPDPNQEFGGKVSVSKESFDGTTMQVHLTGSIGWHSGSAGAPSAARGPTMQPTDEYPSWTGRGRGRA